ncbi:MAG: hypothetical protein RQ885_08160 [Desulfurococcales archaeon]|nr:hypothetical protein [Desulfurococcales archaeon]
MIAYLAFSKPFEITYDPSNKNNVTIAVFRSSMLVEAIRIKTSLGKIVIAYSVRRERISRGRPTSERDVRRKLKKLKKGARK